MLRLIRGKYTAPATQEPFWIMGLDDQATATADIYLKTVGNELGGLVYYSDDAQNWSSIDTTIDKDYFVYLKRGQKTYFKSTLDAWSNSYSTYRNFHSPVGFKVGGNILSLIYGDDYVHANDLKSHAYQFCRLFDSSLVTDASELILPMQTTYRCYDDMFYNCTELVNPPVLPATTLAEKCYQYMFQKCTSLEKAPVLPAETIGDNSYGLMFDGCTSLNYIDCKAKYNLGTGYTGAWVRDVAATGTFIKDPDANWSTGVYGIPEGWDVLTEEPADLTFNPAYDYLWIKNDGQSTNTITFTKNANALVWHSVNGADWVEDTANGSITIASGEKLYLRSRWKTAYNQTTNTINTLNTIKATDDCSVGGNILSLVYGEHFNRQDMMGEKRQTFYRLFYQNIYLTDASRLVLPTELTYTYIFSQLFYGCTALTTIPTLPYETLTSNCYHSMFYNCSSLTTPPTLPATILTSNCYNSMFFGSGITTAPTLPATTLANQCYSGMFRNCKSLTTAPVLPALTLVSQCYGNMFNGCSNLNYIKAMFTTTPGTSYTSVWVTGVSSSGTFVKNVNATWTTRGNNGIPNGWDIQTASS